MNAQSMQRFEILQDYPAYSIHKAPAHCLCDVPVIRAGEPIMVNIPGRFGGWKKFAPGSVVSYALQYDDDPIACYERSKELGHKLKWLNACAVSITKEARAKEAYFGFEIGDIVSFEGEKFELIVEANQNVGLKPVD